MLLDRRFRWNNATHQGMQSVCRVRAFPSEGGLGPVIILTNARENQGPPIERVVECLMCMLTEDQDLRDLPGYEEFSSAMWFFGDQVGPKFLRIREDGDTDGCYCIDYEDSLPAEVMACLIGDAEVLQELF